MCTNAFSPCAVNPVILSFSLQYANRASDRTSHTNFHKVHLVSLERVSPRGHETRSRMKKKHGASDL